MWLCHGNRKAGILTFCLIPLHTPEPCLEANRDRQSVEEPGVPLTPAAEPNSWCQDPLSPTEMLRFGPLRSTLVLPRPPGSAGNSKKLKNQFRQHQCDCPACSCHTATLVAAGCLQTPQLPLMCASRCLTNPVRLGELFF